MKSIFLINRKKNLKTFYSNGIPCFVDYTIYVLKTKLTENEKTTGNSYNIGYPIANWQT